MRRLIFGSLDDTMTLQQFRILNQVDLGLGQTQISQNLQVSMAAVSKMVNVLVQKELIVREVGENRRCVKLSLTARGLKVRNTINSQVERVLNKHFKKLTESEKSELSKGLEILDKLMGYINEE